MILGESVLNGPFIDGPRFLTLFCLLQLFFVPLLLVPLFLVPDPLAQLLSTQLSSMPLLSSRYFEAAFLPLPIFGRI